MKKLLSLVSALVLGATPVLAEPEIKQWNSAHSMGCMLLRECTEGVEPITDLEVLKSRFPDSNFDIVGPEFLALKDEMSRIGIGVYLADEKYFVRGTRGIYHTVGNNFFLNTKYMWDPKTLLSVTRHEGWHAVQDCMAGSIDNNSIAVVWHDGVVPQGYQVRANVAYAMMPAAIPWEAEAIWAGDTAYQTVNALKACKNPNGDIWQVYSPTPMTGEWLIDNGFWDGVVK